MRRRPRKKADDAAIVALLGGGQSYIDKILSVQKNNLVGLWPQDEASGSVSFDKSGNRFNGAYTGVTLGVAGITPGITAAFYDGTNDYNDIHSAGLANDNRLSNPGFETAGGGGADIWANWFEVVGSGALANEAAGQYEGADAAKVTAGATANTFVNQNATVVPGKTYRLRFWTKGDGTYDGRYQVINPNAPFQDFIGRTATGVTAGTYAMVEAEFTPSAGVTVVTVRLWCPTTDTGVAYFDATEVRSMDGFLGDEGTLLAWAKTDAWEDGSRRWVSRLLVDAENYVLLRKSNVNNTFDFIYEAGDTVMTQNTGSLSSVDWACYAITWSKSGDTAKYYIDGAASGAADTGMGTWVGDLSATTTMIGAEDTTPSQTWDGNIGPVALWNTALTAAQIAHVSKV